MKLGKVKDSRVIGLFVPGQNTEKNTKSKDFELHASMIRTIITETLR